MDSLENSAVWTKSTTILKKYLKILIFMRERWKMTFKKLISLFIALVFLSSSVAFAAKKTYVKGYTKKNGTYVHGHYRKYK